LWPIGSEVFKEPAVMQTIAIGHFGPLQPNIVSQTVVGFETGSIRTAVAVYVRESELSNLHITPDFPALPRRFQQSRCG
jgi:hypothetical protein